MDKEVKQEQTFYDCKSCGAKDSILIHKQEIYYIGKEGFYSDIYVYFCEECGEIDHVNHEL